MDDFRVCFAHSRLGIFHDWEDPKWLPRAGDFYCMRYDRKLIRFTVDYILWMEQNYAMIMLSNAIDHLSGEPVDL